MKPIDREKALKWLEEERLQCVAKGEWDRANAIEDVITHIERGHFDIDPPVPDIQPGDWVRVKGIPLTNNDASGKVVVVGDEVDVQFRDMMGEKYTARFDRDRLEVINDD